MRVQLILTYYIKRAVRVAYIYSLSKIKIRDGEPATLLVVPVPKRVGWKAWGYYLLGKLIIGKGSSKGIQFFGSATTNLLACDNMYVPHGRAVYILEGIDQSRSSCVCKNLP